MRLRASSLADSVLDKNFKLNTKAPSFMIWIYISLFIYSNCAIYSKIILIIILCRVEIIIFYDHEKRYLYFIYVL